MDISWYDPNTKSLAYAQYRDNGRVVSGTLTCDGNVLTVKGKQTVEGKQYETRTSYALAADGLSYVLKGEFSPDGKTWTVYLDAKGTKVLPAPKK